MGTKRTMRRKMNPEVLQKVAYEDGYRDGTKLVLDYLGERYIKGPDAPERGSDEALAMLRLANECAEFIQGRLKEREAKIGRGENPQ